MDPGETHKAQQSQMQVPAPGFECPLVSVQAEGRKGLGAGKKNLGVLVDETPPQELVQTLGSPTQEKHGPARGRLE